MNEERTYSEQELKPYRYPRLPRVKAFVVAIIFVILLIGFVIWGFFGTYAITVSGISYEVNDISLFLIPYDVSSYVNEGDQVWIGNDKGTIEYVLKNRYITYDIIAESYFFDANSPYIDPGTTYVLAKATFDEPPHSVGNYRIAIGSQSLFKRIKQIFSSDR